MTELVALDNDLYESLIACESHEDEWGLLSERVAIKGENSRAAIFSDYIFLTVQ
jgi:hypothetical protein